MKKNILTIIILAITLINTILTVVLIFAIVPTLNKTNKLVTKVGSIVDLELESPEDGNAGVSFSDIKTHEFEEPLTITLKKSSGDKKNHYALLSLSLTLNSKHEDYEELNTKIVDHTNVIEEIVTEEFGKYTMDEVTPNKGAIKKQILERIQDLMQSDFIMNISFGNIILS